MNASDHLEAFIEAVAADPILIEQLEKAATDEELSIACAQLATFLGLVISAHEVQQLLRERSLAWLQRQIL